MIITKCKCIEKLQFHQKGYISYFKNINRINWSDTLVIVDSSLVICSYLLLFDFFNIENTYYNTNKFQNS